MKQNEKSSQSHKSEKSWGEMLEQLDKPRFAPKNGSTKWGLSRLMTEQRKYHRSKD